MADDKNVRQYLDQDHDKIFEANKKWVESKKTADPAYFDKLAAGQAPDYLFVPHSPIHPMLSYLLT